MTDCAAGRLLKEEIERSICFVQSPENMTIDDQKEQFSFAYVRAVAAVSRIAVSEPTVDDDSVDLLFQQRDGGGVVLSPRLEAQVKCTDAAVVTATHVAYPLKMKNYDDLRATNLLVPRLLIVVVVPDQLNDWVNHSEKELAIRKCGYWLSLFGEPAVQNVSTRTVHVPRSNQFTVVHLSEMMQRMVRDRDHENYDSRHRNAERDSSSGYDRLPSFQRMGPGAAAGARRILAEGKEWRNF